MLDFISIQENTDYFQICLILNPRNSSVSVEEPIHSVKGLWLAISLISDFCPAPDISWKSLLLVIDSNTYLGIKFYNTNFWLV